ncbi:MAG: CoA pyrophosphatase [Acidimicrobiia bacterium]|nr:CoA pyrophosphatase [Acidimicrobiia bacterium]
MAARGGQQRIPRPPGTRRGGPPPWAGAEGARGPVALAEAVDRITRGPAPMAPTFNVSDAREAAVLVALYEDQGDTHVVLTKRPETMPSHQGEIAFPGGKRDPGDVDLAAAALREAHEEVGIVPAQVEILGELDTIATVASAFTITPIVGLLPAPPQLVPDPFEVVDAFGISLSELLHPDTYREEFWDLWGEYRSMTFFELPSETVWGATARILTRLLTIVTTPT